MRLGDERRRGALTKLRRLRDECLNEHLFCSLPDARATPERWRNDDNAVRPHTSLDGLAPYAFAERCTTSHNPNGLWL